MVAIYPEWILIIMAAIIAQITRANRERKRKKTYEIQKCMYDLPPFDPHFDPLIHNKYLARWEIPPMTTQLRQKSIKVSMWDRFRLSVEGWWVWIFFNILSPGENSWRRDRKRRSALRKLWPVTRGLSRRQLGLKLTNVAFPPVS